MKDTLMAILNKPIKEGEQKPFATAAWISEKDGTPLSGLIRKGKDIKEMDKRTLESISTVPSLLWENLPRALEELAHLEKKEKSAINHVTIGFNYPKKGKLLSGNMEISVIKQGRFYLNSVYKIPERK
ncbi:MAG: hypothetical protein ACXAEU_14640 [Candidatus Hodarchaeales archaeon]